MTVAITRTDHDAVGLRGLASQEKDAQVARRLLALALVMEGFSRSDAARGGDGASDAARLGASL